MTEAESDLARQLLVLPGWTWAPGMVDLPQPGFEPFRIRDVAMDDRWNPPAQVVSRGHGFTLARNLGPPDLRDPATAGVLLRMLQRTGRLTALTPHVAYDAWYVELDTDPWGEPSIAEEPLGVAVARALVAVGRCA